VAGEHLGYKQRGWEFTRATFERTKEQNLVRAAGDYYGDKEWICR
jgi:hypothetical protein